MRGSRTGRPVMALLDLLGRRWSLRVIWELRDGRYSFRALQQQCGEISPSVLNSRLGELRDAGVIELQEQGGYQLTKEGKELLSMLLPIQAWAERWARRRTS